MQAHVAELWRDQGFSRLWAGQTISAFGSMIGGGALQFTAILFLRATPIQMAFLAAANLVPGFLVALPAGAWIDRMQRRPVMIGADLGRALLLGSIPLAALLHVLRMEQVYLVAALSGALTFLFDIAYRAYLPSLVTGGEALIEANSRLAASASVAEITGFGIGGWLVQWLSGPAAIQADAISFLVSAACVRSIRVPEPAFRRAEERRHVGREMLDGVRLILRSPLLRPLAASSATLQIGWGMYGAIVLLFVTRGLGFQPGVAGVIFSTGGLSSLLGAVAARPLLRRFGVGRVLILALTVFGVTQFFIPLARGATLAAAMLIVAGQLIGDFSEEIYEIDDLSLRQVFAPERSLGRVEAAIRFLGLGASLAGALLAGVLGQWLGLRATLVIATLGTFLGALWLVLSPVRSVINAGGASTPAKP